MIQIYHNPKCSKSRCGLELLKESNKAYQVVDYLEYALTIDVFLEEHFKGKTLTDEQIIEAMVQYPQLIERPIVVVGDKAVIGRPTEKINDII